MINVENVSNERVSALFTFLTVLLKVSYNVCPKHAFYAFRIKYKDLKPSQLASVWSRLVNQV